MERVGERVEHDVEFKERRPHFYHPCRNTLVFPVQHNDDDTRVDRTKTVCRRRFAEVRYVAGNTSGVLTQERRHHSDMSVTGPEEKWSVQQLIPSLLVLAQTGAKR